MSLIPLLLALSVSVPAPLNEAMRTPASEQPITLSARGDFNSQIRFMSCLVYRGCGEMELSIHRFEELHLRIADPNRRKLSSLVARCRPLLGEASLNIDLSSGPFPIPEESAENESYLDLHPALSDTPARVFVGLTYPEALASLQSRLDLKDYPAAYEGLGQLFGWDEFGYTIAYDSTLDAARIGAIVDHGRKSVTLTSEVDAKTVIQYLNHEFDHALQYAQVRRCRRAKQKHPFADHGQRERFAYLHDISNEAILRLGDKVPAWKPDRQEKIRESYWLPAIDRD